MTDKNTPARRRRRRTRGEHGPATEAAESADAILDTPEAETWADAVPAKTKGHPRHGGKDDPANPANQAEAPKGDTPELFQTATHQAVFPKAANMQRGFQTIVTDLFDSGYDVKQEWDDVRAGLEITDALTPERLKRAANGQEKLADRAHQLYIVAKVEVQAYMRDTEATHGAIRTAATQLLEVEKANKTRTKQITDADVKAECARAYPDQWRDICARREKAEAMLRHIENLAGLAKSRCYTVSNMAHPGNRSV